MYITKFSSQETLKNQKRRFKKKVEKPDPSEVFSSPRFTGFCFLYFKIATALGAFQEMGRIYFQARILSKMWRLI